MNGEKVAEAAVALGCLAFAIQATIVLGRNVDLLPPPTPLAAAIPLVAFVGILTLAALFWP
jgi:hypothetical protein